MADTPVVVSVVVTHNGQDWIDQCLRSLVSSDIPVEIILVDNASTDNTLDVVNTVTSVRCIPLQQNIGFGKANNIGISAALSLGADYVFFLNQDAGVPPGTIRHLVEEAELDSRYGVLSPVHLDDSGSALDPNFIQYVASSGGDMFADLYFGRRLRTYPVNFVNAAAWLISRRCLETVGGFDPVFFMYEEDADYCRRVLFHGFQIGIVGSCHIWHSRCSSPVNLHSSWHRRKANIQRLSNRVFNTNTLLLKDPQYRFAYALCILLVEYIRSLVIAAANHSPHYILVLTIGFVRTVRNLGVIFAHRRQSFQTGRLWIEDAGTKSYLFLTEIDGPVYAED